MEIGCCTKAKADSASTPRKLYEPSALFRKARSYVDKNHDEWYVLSAKYRVLEPDGSPIEPYDRTLNNASVEDRHEWSHTVLEQLRECNLLVERNTLVIHAGMSYYEELLPLLDDEPVDSKQAQRQRSRPGLVGIRTCTSSRAQSRSTTRASGITRVSLWPTTGRSLSPQLRTPRSSHFRLISTRRSRGKEPSAADETPASHRWCLSTPERVRVSSGTLADRRHP